MKTNFLLPMAVAMFIVMALASCDKSVSPTTLEGQRYSFDGLFEHVSSNVDVEDGNALHISYEYTSGSDELFVTKTEQKKLPDNFLQIDLNNNNQRQKYSVSCDNGPDSFDVDCNGSYSCGKLIKDCLDAGGCATVCGGAFVYYPPIRHFVVARLN